MRQEKEKTEKKKEGIKEKKTWGRRKEKISSSFKFDFLSERESSFSLEL